MRGTIEKRRPDYKVSGIRCIYMYEAHWLVYRCLYNKRFIYYETRLITNSFFFFFIDYIIACKINNETQQM